MRPPAHREQAAPAEADGFLRTSTREWLWLAPLCGPTPRGSSRMVPKVATASGRRSRRARRGCCSGGARVGRQYASAARADCSHPRWAARQPAMLLLRSGDARSRSITSLLRLRDARSRSKRVFRGRGTPEAAPRPNTRSGSGPKAYRTDRAMAVSTTPAEVDERAAAPSA